MEYFGNLGTSRSLEVTFIPVVPVSGRVEPVDDGNPRQRLGWRALIGEYNLTFDDSRGAGGRWPRSRWCRAGYNPADGTLALTVAGGP